MQIKTPDCPTCGKKATGIIEFVYCTQFLKFDEDGEALYAGDNRMHWDSQTPETNEAGEYLLTCGEHEWDSVIEGWEDACAAFDDEEDEDADQPSPV